jgi:hypothetical protein
MGAHWMKCDQSDLRRQRERCEREIAECEQLLRAGHGDVEGLCRALSDWSGELTLLTRSGMTPTVTKPWTERPRVLTVADILAHDSGDTSMLIEGHLPATGAVLLVGATKSGKTIMAVQMAIAVASGAPLYGKYSVVAPGAVLVVEQDDPAGISSVKAILQRSEVPTTGISFHLVTEAPQFGSAFISWLEDHIAALSLRLVVLDSYTALRGPRPKGVDIVKAEQVDLRQLDALAKRTRCVTGAWTTGSESASP